MKLAGLMIIGAGAAMGMTMARADSTQMSLPGVHSPRQAQIDYMLKCQGCHRPDGSGDRTSNPPMTGAVAHFLKVPGGREYLGRVPGVATTDLDDVRLANLLNWTLYRFDRASVPNDFKPYDAAEIRRLRASPLRVEAARTRAQLIAKMPGGSL
ncbi:cytochrome C [Aquisediminimonas profunda]|uniref:cytochrome C n=1 Tax=Aquisediminimonas profunda TaxID=1550733 RepID=UPI001FE886A3|nr:cytochrome C [Aquisediminimonas profunda]